MPRQCPDPAASMNPGAWLLRLLLVVALCLPVAALPAVAQQVPVPTAPRDLAVVRINIIDLLANEPRLPLPIRQRRDVLRTYYEEFGGDLLWLGSERAAALVGRLTDAESDGLSPDDYPGARLGELMQAAGATDKRSLAIIELYFSAAYLEYVSDLHVGRFLPAKVDPNFFLADRSIDQAAALRAVAASPDLHAVLDAWSPRAADYRALHEALASYRALAAAGGWGTVPLGETLKPGMLDARVPALRARLAVTDGAAVDAADPMLYDDALAEAVKHFQARHGLEVDAVVGPATFVAMNVRVEDRIHAIALAMERWRWMPEDLGRQHLIVNIAGFELRRVNDGAVEERMAVVVGKPYSRTPVFSDRIRYLEFNPYWTVPSGIAIKEELPKLQRNPAGLASQGFEALAGGDVYDLRAINWNAYGPGNFPFQLRQKPGTNNALGQVKFMFPNTHNVYLHDTPSRSLFGRAERAFSHGCIRLSRPLDLADQVLAAGGVAGWTPARIDSVVATQKNTVVNLATPLPVHITYLTAWVGDGGVNFRGDIYEHDAKLMAALGGKALAW